MFLSIIGECYEKIEILQVYFSHQPRSPTDKKKSLSAWETFCLRNARRKSTTLSLTALKTLQSVFSQNKTAKDYFPSFNCASSYFPGYKTSIGIFEKCGCIASRRECILINGNTSPTPDIRTTSFPLTCGSKFICDMKADSVAIEWICLNK